MTVQRQRLEKRRDVGETDASALGFDPPSCCCRPEPSWQGRFCSQHRMRMRHFVRPE